MNNLNKREQQNKNMSLMKEWLFLPFRILIWIGKGIFWLLETIILALF